MRRVLLPTPDYPPSRGGVARYLSAIAKTFPSVEVFRWQKVPSTIEAMKELWRRRRSYDEILVSHLLPVGTAAWLLWPLTRKDYVVVVHGMDFDLARRNPWKFLLTKEILRCKAVVANSQALADEVEAFVGKKPVVIYPCVSDELIEAAAVIGPKPATDTVTLLTVARLVERKGHLKVLRAMKELPGHVRYKIVGDGMMRKDIEKAIADLGLRDRVELLQNIGDGKLPELYRSADIFVMPTTKTSKDREGFGIVYLEAQLFELPVVATNHPGVDEAVCDGETGMLIEDSHEALVAALRRLVEDAQMRSRLGAEGRARVLRVFTREAQMKKFADVL